MNVLLVTDEMEIGGSQRQITELALGLRRHGDAVTVCYFRHGSFLLERLRAAQVGVIELPKSGRIDPGFVLRLARTVRDGRFDVVHAFAFTAELWTAIALAALPRERRPALVTSIRGTYEWYSSLQWRLKRWATRRSAAVVANATAAARFAFGRMGLDDRRLRIVRNGIAAPTDRDALRGRHRETLGIGPEVPLALFVGRLVDHKNLPMLVRAASRLARAGSAIRLAIVGDGPLAGALRADLDAAGLARSVALLGARDDATALMCAADVLVLPSWREGLPNVVVEAMHAGCPVVATRVGGLPELVDDGVDGLLVPSDDDAALADALVRLERDPALRARLASAARARAARDHGVDAMVAAMRAVYADLLRDAAPIGATRPLPGR